MGVTHPPVNLSLVVAGLEKQLRFSHFRAMVDVWTVCLTAVFCHKVFQTWPLSVSFFGSIFCIGNLLARLA
jgi:hypothetical protein